MAAASRELEFVDEKERELYAAAMLGENVRRFLQEDPVGRYLHHRVKNTIREAEIDALDIDPDGWGGWFRARRKLRQIRLRAEAARLVLQWFGDAIVDGNQSAKQLEEYRT